jgi:hypothetical protein
LDTLATLAVGSKDLSQDLFDVWRGAFAAPRLRKTALQQQIQVRCRFVSACVRVIVQMVGVLVVVKWRNGGAILA